MTKKAAKKKASKKKASKKAARKPGGRPSKFETINLEQAEKLAKKGWTDKEMAEFFGVTEQTWNNWKLKHPEFFESLKAWKEVADARVERSLFERATGYQHPEEKIFQNNGEVIRADTVKQYPPDTTAAIFWLKNRQKEKWRDRHEFTKRTEVEDATDEELEAALRQRIANMQAQGIDVSHLLTPPDDGGDS